jgi:ubiquinone/menaquinone biosynthesis C-methylase UbiE
LNTKTVYSRKAEKYAKYRWDYAPQSIEAIFEIAQLSPQSILADMGAGTGILTRHFINRVGRIYAIEPNRELRQILAKDMETSPSVLVIDGSAEDTTLPKDSVDIITVAQAIHWFDPEPARNDLLRILKKDGWLALLRNYGTNKEKGAALGSLMVEEYGVDFTVTNEQRPKEKPVRFYFGNDDFRTFTFPFQFNQTYEEFISGVTSASFMPDEDHPLFNKLEKQARQVFAEYSQDGYWLLEGETELIIGQPSCTK